MPQPPFDFGFNAKSREAQAWAKKFSANRVRKVSEDTLKAIRKIIVDSIHQGVPPLVAAKQIRNVVGMTAPQALAAKKYEDGLSPNLSSAAKAKSVSRLRKKYIRRRAIMIARTEVIDSLAAGMEQSWGQAQKKKLLGKNAKKKWLATSFGACAICRSLANEEPVPLHGNFFATLAPPSLKPISRPTAHPNCRCALIPVPGTGGMMFPAAAAPPSGALSEAAWMDTLLTKKVGGAKGSNLGGVYEDAKGAKHYVKEYKNPQQAMSEAAANSVYRELGLEVPESFVRVGSDGKTYFVSKWMDDMEGTLGNLGMTAADANKILDGFVADVFTMNWDAVGTGLDNVVRLASGKIVRIDQGGAFLFRAQGALKPANLLNKIGEWESFVAQNPYYKQVFLKAGIKSADDLAMRAVDQVNDLISVRSQYGSWDNFLKKTNPNLDSATRKKIADMMEARYALLKNKSLKILDALDETEKLAEAQLAAAPKPYSVTTKKGAQKILNKAKTYEEIWKRVLAGEKAKGIAAAVDLNVNNVYRIIRELKKSKSAPSSQTVLDAFKSRFKFWADKEVRTTSHKLTSEMVDRYNAYLNIARPATMSSIRSYTGGGYSAMNKALRGLTQRWTPKTRRMQKFLVEAPPPPPDLVVWRGTRTIGTLVESGGKKYYKPGTGPSGVHRTQRLRGGNEIAEGDVLQLDGFQSTAIHPEKAWSHGDRTMLEIHPTCGAYVDIVSSNSGEKEFIMPHGQQFRVVAIKMLKIFKAGRVRKMRVIQMEAIGGCPKVG